ncbi:MAG: pilus assembly protein PilB [Verrucomicrobia bacterium]|nr:MAG: pilus assembly protein PilB [Verrucomicrobiota bacterium]
MFEAQSIALYEMLRDRELVDRVRLDELFQEHRNGGKPLSQLLVDFHLVTAQDLLSKVAEYLGWDFVPRPPGDISEAALATVDGSMARMYGVVPLRADATTVDLLVKDPFNSQIVDDLTFALRRDVRLVVTDPDQIDGLIRHYYGEDDSSIEDLLEELTAGPVADAEDLSEQDIEAMAGETPIVRFVNLVLSQAIRDKASDIHFEPFESEFKIRYRIDGALYELSPPPVQLALPITSRLKVIASLNIAERRVPQDGRIKITIGGHQVDLRVSTLPTQFGESVVLRVLDQSVIQLDIDSLGMPQDVFTHVDEIIRRPNGIFVVTGPTGSGKTTTLYSCLRTLNRAEVKILTAEDPVEYEVEGIMQVAVRTHVGLTFSAALRSFLRQDPDIIMVGEVRDLDTAQIAIQASLTGHLVMTTLHTNDAPGAVTRLIDMGVEPFLIASSLEAVLAQRLVRRICPDCRQAYRPGGALLEQLGVKEVEESERNFYQGEGCDFCHDTGYRGRMGIFEMLRVTEPIRELLTQRAPALAIRHQALRDGMRTLRDDGLRAIHNGFTTIEEVIKYT